jgi:hypothetical protein
VAALPLLLAVALRATSASPQLVAPTHLTAAPAAESEPATADAPRQGAKAALKKARRTPAKAQPAGRTDAPSPAADATAPDPGAPSRPDEGSLLVEHKCAKCHDVALAYSSELSDVSWRLHMKRMAARPGAAITDEQGRKIHEYLKARADRAR